MRRLLALSILAVSAFAAKSASADDPKTYTLPAHETWKVGDVVSRHEADHKVTKKIVKGADGAVMQNETTDEMTEFSAVLKVLEVNGEGQYTKASVYFTQWSKTAGETSDKSLEGKHVEVAGAGQARTAKVVTPGAVVSPEALAWLDEDMGKGAAKHSELDSVFNPKKAVAVGESWVADIAAVQKAFGDQMNIVADKSTVKLTLTGVEKDVATVAIEFALQVGSLETPGGKMDVKEGGVFSMKAEGAKPLTPGVHGEGSKMTGTFKFVIVAGPGIDVDLDVAMDNQAHVEAGGEIPDLPATK